MSVLHRIVGCGLLAAVLITSLAGCRPPWESDEVTLDVPSIDLARARQDAIVALQQAAEDGLASNRFVAIEAIPAAMGAKGGPICKQALADSSPEVRLAAAIGIGDLRYAPALEKLQGMAQFKTASAERDSRVYCGVIYALHQLGDESHTTNLGSLLFNREPEVRTAAAMVLGKMRVKAAISPLKSALGDLGERDDDMKFELTRALARCGDKTSLRRLEGHTLGRFVDEQVIAVNAMLELQSPMCRTLFTSLANNDRSPRVRTTAAGGLASLGHETAELFRYCVRAALEPEAMMKEALAGGKTPSLKEVTFLQSIGAAAVANFRHPQALDVTGSLLKSPNPVVRVAAAGAILKSVPQLRNEEPIRINKTPVAPEPKDKPEIKRPKLHTAGAKD